MPDIVQALLRTGETRPLRPGVVAAYDAGASVITVTLDGAQVVMPCLDSVTPYGVGKTVQCMRNGRSSWLCLGVQGTAVPGIADPFPLPGPLEPAEALRSTTVLPVFTGSYRAGWRIDSDQLIQGNLSESDRNTGYAGYGQQLVALGADLTMAVSAVLMYQRDRIGLPSAQTPTMQLWAERTPPPNNTPTAIASPVDGAPVYAGQSVTWPLPADWTTALLDGTAGGLGVHVDADAPYVSLDGLAEYGASFALQISYYA